MRKVKSFILKLANKAAMKGIAVREFIKEKLSQTKQWLLMPSFACKGEVSIGTVIGIIIAIVLGGLLLAGLYLIIKDGALPDIKQKISGLFDFTA